MNQKRYWLRWGLSLAVIATSVFILAGLVNAVFHPSCQADCSSLNFIIWHILFSLNILGIPGAYILFSIYPEITHVQSIALIQGLIFLTIFCFYFLLGAILGWIYGKIKNRTS
jgi:hypothetical protein